MVAKLNDDIKNKIVDFLKDKGIGASSSEISKGIKHNRITISKYLEIMHAHNILDCKDIAQAKIWSLAQKHFNKKILIVDDEPHIVSLIKLSLKPNKYTILEASNGLEAIRIAQNEKPDLILLDLMMPEMDGFETCKKIKSNSKTKECTVIMLSAKNEQENKFKGIDLGADDYITKPFDPTELEERIDSILFSDNNKDFNSITGLPNKAAMKKYIDEKKETRTVLEIKIKNQDVFREKFGVNNVEKVLKLISRLLKDKVKDDLSSEVFHVEDNKFAIFSKISNLSEEISQSFSYLIPFIYHNKNPDEKLELEFKEVKITR